MSGLAGVVYRPNPCSCGHDLVVHTPNCTQCPTAHAFAPDPAIVQTAGVPANGQRGG